MRSFVAASVVGVVGAVVVEEELEATARYHCPGSSSLNHAWMEVTVTADVSCDLVHAEIVERAGGGSWVDPHNGGIYSVVHDSDTTIHTQRTTNPVTSVGGVVYVDLQIFELKSVSGGCQIKGCSESQGNSFSDFSTNYCDLRNLYCGAADDCQTALNPFTVKENSYHKSFGAGHDFSGCVVKKEEVNQELEAAVEGYACPGSSSLNHAWMEVTSTANVPCDLVHEEIVARASGGSWVDPHNGGIYSVLQDTETSVVNDQDLHNDITTSTTKIYTQRTTNPVTSVGGAVYVDKQIFELKAVSGGCQIKGCSESQGNSFSDFSTNYCDLRNLYCGAADDCQTVLYPFTVKENSYHKSFGAGHDFSGCVVKSAVSV